MKSNCMKHRLLLKLWQRCQRSRTKINASFLTSSFIRFSLQVWKSSTVFHLLSLIWLVLPVQCTYTGTSAVVNLIKSCTANTSNRSLQCDLNKLAARFYITDILARLGKDQGAPSQLHNTWKSKQYSLNLQFLLHSSNVSYEDKDNSQCMPEMATWLFWSSQNLVL